MKKKPQVLGISEAARELGLSAEWLGKGERRGFPKARRDKDGYRYYTPEDLERLRNRRTLGRDA